MFAAEKLSPHAIFMVDVPEQTLMKAQYRRWDPVTATFYDIQTNPPTDPTVRRAPWRVVARVCSVTYLRGR